jgi:methyl-accepting chemotaxis protein
VKVSFKLWLINGLAVLALLLVSFLLLRSERNTLHEDRERATRYAVETAAAMVEHLGKAAESGALPREQAQQRALAQLRDMRYDGSEYFWVNDLQPRMIMHPTKPELEGKDLRETRDPSGKPLFNDMVAVVQAQGAGFVEYRWPRPGSDQPVPKISYVKGYAPWGWVIGSGVYVDDIDTAVAAHARRLGQVVLAIILAMSAASALLARSIGRRVRTAAELADEVAQGRYDNRFEVRGRDEIARLMQSLASMQARLLERRESGMRNAREMSRLKCALDNADMCVRVADNDGTVIYVNHALRDTLRRDEAAFRRENPAFAADRVVGGSIGVFYADAPAAIERLRRLERTTRSRMTLGGRTYDVITTPIVSEDGERLGTVGQWLDRTDQIKTEEEIAGIVQAAVRGDLSGRIVAAGKEGFFLQLAEAMNGLMQISESGLNDTVRVLSALARADLTESIDGEYQGIFRRLKDDANKTVSQLTGLIGHIKRSADTIGVASQAIATGNADLSQRTEEQSASLEEVAASMAQLTATVQQNARSAHSASEMASKASRAAGDSGQTVRALVQTMGAISESSQKIVDIVRVIDEIAFQINILALNAAVEAARSGEHGRGFAVVASEVRKLANRSAVAAKGIKELIDEAATKVHTGNELVAQAGESMEETVAEVNHVSEVIGQISAASAEQSEGIVQVNQAIAQMETVTRQNAALVDEAAGTADSMEQQAQELGALMGRFRLERSAQAAVAETAD